MLRLRVGKNFVWSEVFSRCSYVRLIFSKFLLCPLQSVSFSFSRKIIAVSKLASNLPALISAFLDLLFKSGFIIGDNVRFGFNTSSGSIYIFDL